ncbi:hypothetical protein LF63_0104335 [Oleiagrimonas soli]|nr:hypothetical protein LF63_0104335 [Oleiagrimonas soli]
MLLALALSGAAQAGDATPPSHTTLTYDGAAIANLGGGLRRDTAYVGNLRLDSTFDLDRIAGWPQTTAYVNAMWLHGGQPDAFIGDAQGVSNLTAPPGVVLEEAWIQRNFNAHGVSLLAGKYDVNSEFYTLQSANLFLNSSFGVGPEFAQSGIDGPSIYPRTALGVRVAYKPSPGVILRTAVMDGVPVQREGHRYDAFAPGDGLLVVSELALLNRPEHALEGDARLRTGRDANLPPYQAKLALGVWHYTTDFVPLDSASTTARRHGATGYYAIAGGVLARDRTHDARALSGFVQFGVGDPGVNRFGRYMGLGAVLSAPLPGRDTDELGLAVARARDGIDYRRLQTGAARTTATETTWEASYLAQVSPWLAVQPDLQYVVHPNADASVPNAWVFSLRFELSYDL